MSASRRTPVSASPVVCARRVADAGRAPGARTGPVRSRLGRRQEVHRRIGRRLHGRRLAARRAYRADAWQAVNADTRPPRKRSTSSATWVSRVDLVPRPSRRPRRTAVPQQTARLNERLRSGASVWATIFVGFVADLLVIASALLLVVVAATVALDALVGITGGCELKQEIGVPRSCVVAQTRFWLPPVVWLGLWQGPTAALWILVTKIKRVRLRAVFVLKAFKSSHPRLPGPGPGPRRAARRLPLPRAGRLPLGLAVRQRCSRRAGGLAGRARAPPGEALRALGRQAGRGRLHRPAGVRVRLARGAHPGARRPDRQRDLPSGPHRAHRRAGGGLAVQARAVVSERLLPRKAADRVRRQAAGQRQDGRRLRQRCGQRRGGDPTTGPRSPRSGRHEGVGQRRDGRAEPQPAAGPHTADHLCGGARHHAWRLGPLRHPGHELHLHPGIGSGPTSPSTTRAGSPRSSAPPTTSRPATAVPASSTAAGSRPCSR